MFVLIGNFHLEEEVDPDKRTNLIPGFGVGQFVHGSLHDAETLAPLRGTGGAYLTAQQMLLSRPEDPFVGFSSWLLLSWAPENRNPVPSWRRAPLLYQGIIPSARGTVSPS